MYTAQEYAEFATALSPFYIDSTTDGRVISYLQNIAHSVTPEVLNIVVSRLEQRGIVSPLLWSLNINAWVAFFEETAATLIANPTLAQ